VGGKLQSSSPFKGEVRGGMGYLPESRLGGIKLTMVKINRILKISAKAGIQFENTGFPRTKYGAGLAKP